MLLLKDIQLAEGLLGGLTAILALYIKDNIKDKTNAIIIVFILWCFLFYIRKIMLNLYRHYKKINNISNKNLTIDVKDDDFNNYLLIFSGSLLLIIYLLSNNTSIVFDTKISNGSLFIVFLIVGIIISAINTK